MFADFVVTECAEHGVKVTADMASAEIYVESARYCDHMAAYREDAHDASHESDGSDCWVCCPAMVIDPNGYFDH